MRIWSVSILWELSMTFINHRNHIRRWWGWSRWTDWRMQSVCVETAPSPERSVRLTFFVKTFSSTFKPAVLSVYLHYRIWACLWHWCNIILCWFPDNTAGIVTRRSGFQQRVQDVYVLPVVVEDSGYPAQSSTTTLTIRVCSCEAGGSLLTCSAEAIFLPVGLSTGALMAILLCVILLIGKSIFHLSPSSVTTTSVWKKHQNAVNKTKTSTSYYTDDNFQLEQVML